MKRLLCVLLLLSACGKSQQKVEAPTLAPANPARKGHIRERSGIRIGLAGVFLTGEEAACYFGPGFRREIGEGQA